MTVGEIEAVLRLRDEMSNELARSTRSTERMRTDLLVCKIHNEMLRDPVTFRPLTLESSDSAGEVTGG